MLASTQKKMIRNTGMLYIRMFFVLGASLYTSRVVLNVLGEVDFGLYYVVAGFVAVMGFLHGAMTSATQRYFAFELGKGGIDSKQLRTTFSTSLNIHIIVAIAIIITAEALGLWFIATKLQIPAERLDAAYAVFHMAVASFALSVISVPFTALIMAHERMGVFASIGIAEVLLKLVLVIALQFIGGDNLINYAFFMLGAALFVFAIYVLYYVFSFKGIRYVFGWDSRLFKEVLSYTAWNTWGNLAAVMSAQGTNVLLNMFFGPSINAARSIAYQANTALTSFIQSVQSAINPQIIKLYAANDLKGMHKLVMLGAKYNFFLLLLLSFPVIIMTHPLLALWLVKVPAYSTIFLKLIIINSLIDSISKPLMTAVQATGHIRLYQTVIGGVLLLNLPISYYFLLKGYEPYSIVIVSIGLTVSALIFRLLLLHGLISLKASLFAKNVLLRIIYILICLVPISLASQYIEDDSFYKIIFKVAVLVTFSTLVIWLVGATSQERKFISNLIKNKFIDISKYVRT